MKVNFKRLFGVDLEGAKQDMRDRIKIEVEGNLEDEREDGFKEAKEGLEEQISAMDVIQKETIRVDTLKQLNSQKFKIIALIDLFITKTVLFQIWFDIITKLSFFIGIFAILFKAYKVSAIAFMIMLLLIMIGRLEDLYGNISYLVTGTGRTVNKLLDAYHYYGELEARLFLADFRGFSHTERDRKTWVYTTSHTKTAP